MATHGVSGELLRRERARLRRRIFGQALQVLASTPYRAWTAGRARRARRIRAPRGIDALEPITLGGTRQHVLLRGHDRSNPVLLYLHGGLDAPAFFGCHQVGHDTGLERHLTMVYWERLGTGRSWARGIPCRLICVEQSVEDACELAAALRSRFDVAKIYLAGHSWGSALAFLVAARRPDLFHACVGIGQVVAPLADRSWNYRLILEQAERTGNRRALEELRAIGPPPYDELRHMAFDRWSSSYWDEAAGRSAFLHYGLAAALEKLLCAGLGPGWMSPYYNLRDLLAIAIEPNYWLSRIGERMFDVDLRSAAPRIEIPVYFLHGRHDRVSPADLAVEYHDLIEATCGKSVIWFERAGHAPYLRQPDAFRDAVLRVVSETASAAGGTGQPAAAGSR